MLHTNNGLPPGTSRSRESWGFAPGEHAAQRIGRSQWSIPAMPQTHSQNLKGAQAHQFLFSPSSFSNFQDIVCRPRQAFFHGSQCLCRRRDQEGWRRRRREESCLPPAWMPACFSMEQCLLFFCSFPEPFVSIRSVFPSASALPCCLFLLPPSTV